MGQIIDGTTVRMGGADYIVAPLTFKQLRALQEKFETMSSISSVVTLAQMDAIIEIAHAALSRNYPDISIDKVENIIDMGNAAQVISAIIGVSGMEQKTPGEVQGSR